MTVNFIECDVAELKKHLQNGGQNLIDVREYAEFSGGRVKGAKHIPLGEIENRSGEIDRSRTVYVMCRSGKRGAEAQKRLLGLSFSDVRNVSGGFEAWKAAGHAFDKDENAVWSLERQVRFAAGSLVVIGVLLSLLVHPYFVALSAFVGAGLVFAAVTDTCGMAMALSKMPWNKADNAACKSVTRKV
ncbi:MAG: ygaP [Acidobacteria bacterium]|jgi:rhodanese-related sulfurtransferase|nr:ygaP [Acidobacteriota bacterium]